jgi:hypothetical protein
MMALFKFTAFRPAPVPGQDSLLPVSPMSSTRPTARPPSTARRPALPPQAISAEVLAEKYA